MTDTAPIELKLAELSVGDEEARVDPYITPISARAIIPNGVYIIRSSSKANLCLQLNTDDGTNSITASNRDTTYKNLNQQWLLTRQSDNSYRFMNRGRALEMAALLKTCGGDPGSVVGSSEDFFWMLTAFQDAFIIGDPNIAYVVNLTNGGTPTNRVVTLHLFDPDNRLDKQSWHFDLLKGTAPETQILPGYSYRINNVSTGRILGLYNVTPYMFAAGTGDGWYTTWLPIFDAAGKMYMANSSPRGGPPVTTGYLTNGNLSTTPVVSRLIFAEPVSDSAFYIEVDSDGSGDVVADNTLANSYASFEPLDKTKSTQKWKLTRINM